MTTQKILIVDDQRLLCQILSEMLENTVGFTVSGVANNGKMAIEMALDIQPDVILMDIIMPVMGGTEAAKYIKSRLPACKIIALTSLESSTDLNRIMAAGVDGLLSKDCSCSELLSTISTVTHSPTALLTPAPETLPPGTPTLPSQEHGLLSPREIDVIRHLAMGANNKQIAELFGISIKTVESYRNQAMKKLNIASIAELTRYALRTNLISCK